MSLKVKILHIFMVSLDPTIKSPSFSWPLANLQWTRYMSLGLTTTSFISFRHMVVVQSLSHVQLFATLWTAACQASLSFIIFWDLLKLMSIELVMPSNHLILCHPLLLLPSIFPRVRVFSNESALHIRWPKYWSFSFRISPSNEYSGWFPLGLTGLISLKYKGLSRVYSSTTICRHKFWLVWSVVTSPNSEFLAFESGGKET